MSDYKGTIIEESLENASILKQLKILGTKVEAVTEKHQTPWLSAWTLHVAQIPEKDSEDVARQISEVLDREHPWYADFKNDERHLIIFRNKVFNLKKDVPEEYEAVKKYGLSLGIPEHQLDFSPDIK